MKLIAVLKLIMLIKEALEDDEITEAEAKEIIRAIISLINFAS